MYLKAFLNFWSLFFFFFLFIYDSHRERGRDTGRGRSRLPAPGARRGIRSRVSRIMPWAKGRRQTTAPPRDPLFLTSRGPSRLFCTVAATLFIYSWETQRQRYRQRENEAPCGEPDVGRYPPWPRDHDLSQRRCSTTEAPRCLADSISLLIMGVFIFSISSYFSFAHLHISRDLSFLPGLPVC